MVDALRCRGAKICSPFVSRDPLDGAIYYVSAATGEVFAARPPLATGGAHESVAFTGGEPYGAQFDRAGRLHVADAAHAALLRVDDAGQPGVMVKAYEERAFRGPSAIAFAAGDDDDTLYFTDSGPLGETTLEKPRGSVFSISTSPSGGQILRPLALKCLAHPCGVATTLADPTVLFVAEMMQNRVLRLSQRPGGAHHVSVFHQFAGGMGPSCVACDASGSVFVGHYDFAGSGGSKLLGKISVLSADGALQHTLRSSVIVTEASSNAIYQLPVPR
ncbi:hypothetical protein PybrP1_002198 [[Pythium] brassicae (nom. inval.)]|nr:hypothetical protein PybrP1_002198 [[Pythium] brassicae (nom. inval.)]